MKKIFLKIFALLFLYGLLLTSCKRKCENVKIGQTSLSENTASFFPYNDGEQITFLGLNGQVKVFTVNTNESKYFICQEITCRPLDPYEGNYCEYIEAPIKEMFLNSDSTLLGIDASVFAYEPETDLLFESVRFTVSHINSSIIASHITEIRFSSPEFEKSKIPDIENFVNDFETIQLNSTSYNNVLSFEKDGIAFYYNKEIGFIAYEVGNSLYIKQ